MTTIKGETRSSANKCQNVFLSVKPMRKQPQKPSATVTRKQRVLMPRTITPHREPRHRKPELDLGEIGQLQCSQYPRKLLHSLSGQSSYMSLQSCQSQSQKENRSEDSNTIPAPRRVHFDFNGNGVEPRTRTELRYLMRQLLQKRRSCCLLRFSNTRRCSMLFLHHLLVRQVEKFLHTMQGKLINVHLTYYDLLRHDTCNAFRKVLRYRQCYSTTMQLYKWLEREYSKLFGSGQRHECFNIELEFVANQHSTPIISKVHLVIMQMYLHRMEVETRRNLCALLRDPSDFQESYRSRDPAENYFFLQEYLQQFLSGDDQWRTWIFFDVSSQNGDVTTDILKLAKASYQGLKAEKKLLYQKIKEDDNKRLSRLCGGSNKKDLVFIKTPPSKLENYEELNDWVQLVEEKFNNVLKTLKDYYDCKYKQKIINIGECMKLLTRSKQYEEKQELGSNVTISADLTWYQNRYKLAHIDLDRFLEQVEQSNVKSQLVPLLATKIVELDKESVKYKVQQLKGCKHQLIEIINSEIQMLQQASRSSSFASIHTDWSVSGNTMQNEDDSDLNE